MEANKIAAIFESRQHLEQALATLHDAGYVTEEVSLLLKQSAADTEFVQQDTFIERTIAEPLTTTTTETVLVEDAPTGLHVAEVYDPVALSETVPKSESISLQAVPDESASTPALVLADRETEIVDVSTPVTAPEAALKNPNALVQNAAIGGMLGLLAGAAMLMIPGIGPVLAIGPIAAGLGMMTGTAALGATIGTVAGIFADEGIPSDRVELYREAFDAGKGIILLTPRDGTLLASAYTLLEDQHPEHIEMLGAI